MTTITEALFLEVRLGAGWALSPPNFDVFPKLSNFLRYYCTSFGNSWGNSCTMFYTKYQVLLYLWWSLKFLKCFKVPKCYVHDFLRIHCIKKWGLHFRISSVNPQKTLVTFTQEILNGKLHFFVQYSVFCSLNFLLSEQWFQLLQITAFFLKKDNSVWENTTNKTPLTRAESFPMTHYDRNQIWEKNSQKTVEVKTFPRLPQFIFVLKVWERFWSFEVALLPTY